MKLSVLTREFERVIKQRNMLFPIVVLMGISQVLLIMMLFWKDEKTILVPPVLERPFSVDGSAYSASYFEQMGLFISNLILTKSSSTSASQNTLLYKYIDPEMIGSFKRDLLDEEEFLKKDNSGYVFYPKETLVNLGNKSVLSQQMAHLSREAGGQSLLSMDSLKQGGIQGAGSALDKLSEYYIKRAEQLQPVIQIGAGRTVDVVFTQGVKIGPQQPSLDPKSSSPSSEGSE